MIPNLVRNGTAAALVAVLAGTVSTGGVPAQADEAVRVVATTTILGDIVGSVACDGAADVRVLIPSGADPHAYEPTFDDRDALDAADLIVTNGLGLETALSDPITASDPDGQRTFVAADHITTTDDDAARTQAGGTRAPADAPAESSRTGSTEADEGSNASTEPDRHDHGHDGTDPHFWFDPTLVASLVPALADRLVDAGADAELVRTCADDYRRRLTALDGEIAEILAPIPAERRLLVTNHDALGAFADRYGLEIVGSVLPSTSTLAAASPGDLEALAATIDEFGVPAIFTEHLEAVDDASRLADRLDLEVVELYTDSLGDADSGAATYDELLRYDATAVADALG